MLHLLRPAALAGALALCAAAPEAATPPDVPATPPPAAAAPAAPAALPGVGTEEVAADRVVALLGLVVNAEGAKEVGRIVDVLVDGAGKPRAVVVDVGGFLGVGNRKVAVAWTALRFTLGKTPSAMLPLPPDRLKSAPAYDPAKPVEVVEAIQPVVAPPVAASPVATSP